jgi:anti-sigma factor RsiW
MMTHIVEAQLHDLVDDAVAPADRPQLEAHLAACGQCATRLQSLTALQARLRALPRSVEPASDLLPGIRARLRETPSSVAVRTYRWPLLAAAAVVLCVVSSGVTLLIMRGTRPEPEMSSVVPAAVATAQLVELRATETRYVGAIEELRAALHRDQGALEPETVRVLEQSLASIDRALADARAALSADPANAVLAEMLHANYAKKLDLLRRANQHARARL